MNKKYDYFKINLQKLNIKPFNLFTSIKKKRLKRLIKSLFYYFIMFP